ncbi:MAG: PilN domain-containing protein [Candidatus Parabeggiatoa sp.]|nr:PilN domain-containing protein [Candidatus Parabeggiatoa sp.]
MKQQINLFQPTSSKFPSNKPRQLLSSNMLLLGVMVLTCLGLIIIYVSAYQDVSSLREKLQSFSTQNRTVEKRLAKLRRTSLAKPSQSEQSDELETEINQLSAKIETHNQVIEVLQNELQGNTKGFSNYLADLAYQYENINLTRINLRSGGSAITLTGKTSQPDLVPRLITRLSQKSAFQEVYFQTVKLERTDEKQSQSFRFVLDTGSN